MTELARDLHAWRVAKIEGFSDDTQASQFQSQLEYALFVGDVRFFGQLFRELPKPNPRPWRAQTSLEKVRRARVSLDPPLSSSWKEVKELSIELYPELARLTARQWQRLLKDAGLSSPRGRPRR